MYTHCPKKYTLDTGNSAKYFTSVDVVPYIKKTIHFKESSAVLCGSESILCSKLDSEPQIRKVYIRIWIQLHVNNNSIKYKTLNLQYSYVVPGLWIQIH